MKRRKDLDLSSRKKCLGATKSFCGQTFRPAMSTDRGEDGFHLKGGSNSGDGKRKLW